MYSAGHRVFHLLLVNRIHFSVALLIGSKDEERLKLNCRKDSICLTPYDKKVSDDKGSVPYLAGHHQSQSRPCWLHVIDQHRIFHQSTV
jgi:hypothetical protein